MKFFTLMILVCAITANTKIGEEKPKLKERVLSENIVFMHKESHDPETQELREYFEKIKNKSFEDSDAIMINSILNSDKSQTTGNHDQIEKVEYLLPNYDQPTSNVEKQEQSLKHHQFLDNMTLILSPDFFDEDPKMFLGDHDSYFKIVKKRSILFFYISRVILYLTIALIIFRFIQNKESKRQVNQSLYNKSSFQCTMVFQILALSVIISGSVIFFYWIAEPKSIIDDAGSNLIFEFRKINVTSHEISEEIDNINNEKIKIPIDKFGIFQITNTIKYSLSKIEEDVNLAADFSHNMLKNPYLTNYSVSLTIFFNGFLLLGISILSITKMNPSFQTMLFYLSGISLSLTIYTMGMFFANYSGFHDICNSIINVNSRQKMPEQGIGLIKYVGCSQENIFFQQMYIILKAQNSAKKLFNNEMFKIHRPFINGPEDALRISNYLKTIDASSVNITSFADVLERNKELLYKLQTIYNCNLIKNWLTEAESRLCYDGSYDLLKIFWVLCVICLGFVLLMLTANRGSVLLNDYQNIQIVKQLNLKKKRYANEILVD